MVIFLLLSCSLMLQGMELSDDCSLSFECKDTRFTHFFALKNNPAQQHNSTLNFPYMFAQEIADTLELVEYLSGLERSLYKEVIDDLHYKVTTNRIDFVHSLRAQSVLNKLALSIDQAACPDILLKSIEQTQLPFIWQWGGNYVPTHIDELLEVAVHDNSLQDIIIKKVLACVGCSPYDLNEKFFIFNRLDTFFEHQDITPTLYLKPYIHAFIDKLKELSEHPTQQQYYKLLHHNKNDTYKVKTPLRIQKDIFIVRAGHTITKHDLNNYFPHQELSFDFSTDIDQTADAQTIVYTLKKDHEIMGVIHPLKGTPWLIGPLQEHCITISPQGTYVVVYNNQEFAIWHIKEQRKVQSFISDISKVYFNTNETHLIYFNGEQQIIMLEIASGTHQYVGSYGVDTYIPEIIFDKDITIFTHRPLVPRLYSTSHITEQRCPSHAQAHQCLMYSISDELITLLASIKHFKTAQALLGLLHYYDKQHPIKEQLIALLDQKTLDIIKKHLKL